MGVKESFTGASVLAKVSLIIIVVASFFNWIAFSTTSWGVVDIPASKNDVHLGLWRVCSDVTMSCNMLDGYANVWFGVVQAFAILGFMGLNVAFVLILLYIFCESLKRNGDMGMAAAIICIVTAVCWLLAVIVFGAKFEDDDDVTPSGKDKLGYSFGLAIVALILEAVTGVLILLDCKGGGTLPSS